MAKAVGYSVSAEVVGAKELKEAFESIDSFAKNAFMDAVNKAAISFEAKARGLAPHKTGALWNSIHAEPAHQTADNIEAHVGTNLKYARAQEYGTQGMVIHSHSRTGKQFTYIGNIKPKLYFKKAKGEIAPLLTSFMQEALTKIVGHLSTEGSI